MQVSHTIIATNMKAWNTFWVRKFHETVRLNQFELKLKRGTTLHYLHRLLAEHVICMTGTKLNYNDRLT